MNAKMPNQRKIKISQIWSNLEHASKSDKKLNYKKTILQSFQIIFFDLLYLLLKEHAS